MADLAAQWKAFTPEQRDEALSRMTPDQKMKLAGALGYKAPQKTATTPTAPQPEARTAGNYAGEIVRGVGRGIVDDVTGLYNTVRHPRQTVAAVLPDLILPGVGLIPALQAGREAAKGSSAPVTQGTLTTLENLPLVGPLVQRAEQGGGVASPESVGAATEGITEIAAPEAIAPTLRGAKALGGRAVEAITKTSPREMGPLVEKTRAENAASTKAAADAQVVETQRAAHRKILDESSRELQARVETARNNALKAGNEKFNAVREKLNHLPADMEKVNDAYQAAHESLGELQAEPPILKRLGKTLEQAKETLSYKDLQSLYSELGKELSKGSLPGTTYHAYDVLQEAVGEDMQRIADSQGAGAELTDARNYWRRMKQTFGKPLAVRDAASKTVAGVNPEFARQEAQTNRLRLLSHYDPEIEGVAKRAAEARQGLKDLPKPKPTEAETKKIGPEEVRATKRSALGKRAHDIQHYTGRAALYVTGYRSLVALGRAAMGDVSAAAQIPADIGEGIAVSGGGALMARVLQTPKVVELLTKPTARDIAQIPPEMRSDLLPIVRQAQRSGMKVSPALLGAITGSRNYPRGPNTRKLELMRGNGAATQ